MGKGGGGTTVTKTEPWDEQKKYLETAMQAASGLYNNGDLTNSALAPAYYSGQTVAPQSAWTTQALQMQADAAKNMGSNPLMLAANSAAQNVAGGTALAGNTGLNRLNTLSASSPVTQAQALYGNTGMNALNKYATQDINGGNAALAQLNQLAENDNPYMDALYQRANSQAQASLDSNFNRAGRYGSGAHEAAAADAANNLANEMYGSLYGQRINAANAASNAYNQGLGMNINAAQGAGSLYGQGLNTLVSAYGQQAGAANNAGGLYNTGIGQQVAAAQTAQGLAQQPYTDAAMLSEAGGVQDDYRQQLINADIDRYNYDAQRALQALSTYNQLISGNYGGTTNTTGQQAKGSKLGGALGGGMAGASIGTQIMPGWGTAIGGIGGALLGLLGAS